jgi:hypothetical protein
MITDISLKISNDELLDSTKLELEVKVDGRIYVRSMDIKPKLTITDEMLVYFQKTVVEDLIKQIIEEDVIMYGDASAQLRFGILKV